MFEEKIMSLNSQNQDLQNKNVLVGFFEYIYYLPNLTFLSYKNGKSTNKSDFKL